MERLDKLIASRGTLSRKDAQKQIRSGAVTVNGAVCRQIDCKVDPDTDEITVAGQAVCTDRHLYIMLNKPAGVVSATEDRREKTVLDILPEELKRPGLFPPKKHVDKRYIAKLDGEITPEMITAFENGIIFRDGTRCLPAKLEILPETDGLSGIVTICEGKFHQVKKMFSAVGRKVVHLQRISIGNLYLDSKLPIGKAKKMTKLDIDAIFLGNLH